MKLVVLSDSHGDLETVQAVSSLQADAVFHCGDSELSADDPVLNGIHVVRGNCDREERFPAMLTKQVGNELVLVVHGHEHDVKRSMLGLSFAAREQGASIVLFGHSHLYGAEMDQGVLFLNPGSTILPRGGKQASYAVIEMDDKIQVTFYNLQHEPIDQAIFTK